MGNRAPRAFDAESPVERTPWVGHQVEGQVRSVSAQLRSIGMEYDGLSDACRCQLVMASRESAHVHVTDRAPGVAAELEVDKVALVRDPHWSVLYGWQLSRCEDVTLWSLPMLAP